MSEVNIKNKWMKFALKEAEKALKMDEVPIGSVIVKDNTIIGKGYNQVESLVDSTAHAEIIAITSAANYLGDWRLNDCSIYITKEPCLMCYGAILNSRIVNVIYGFSDNDKGFRVRLNKELILYRTHLKNIEGNILHLDCKILVKDFFKFKRKKNKNS